MAYTPTLSDRSSAALRRMAWAMQVPMTKAMEELLHYLPRIIDRQAVCNACRDKSKSKECYFAGEVR